MCIIVAKPAGVELPTWTILENCFNRNSDGAGFMYNKDGIVYIRKGFMTFSEFKKAFREEKRKFDFKESAVVFHFRIKTHGEVSKECCHPFAVSSDLERLRKTECTAKYGAAHNGMICRRSTNSKKSDTMDYVMGVVAPICRMVDDPVHDKNAKLLFSDTLGTSNKLALLDGRGGLLLVGNFQYDKDIAYSNESYKTQQVTHTNYSNSSTLARANKDDKLWYPNNYGTLATSSTYRYPRYARCKKCAWFDTCKKYGAECMSEADAEYMYEAISASERGESNGACGYPYGGYKYDYSDWD